MTENLLQMADTLDFDADTSDFGFLTDQMLDLTEDDLFDLHIPDLETVNVEEEEDDDDLDEINYDLELEATLFFTDEHQFSTSLGSSFKDILASSPGFVKYDPTLCLSRSPANRQSMLKPTSTTLTAISNNELLDSAYTSSCDSSDFLAMISSTSDDSNIQSCDCLSDPNTIDVTSQPLNTFTAEDMTRLSSALANVGLDILKEMNDRHSKERSATGSGRVSLLDQQQQHRRRTKVKQSKGVSLLAKPPLTHKLVKKNLCFKQKKNNGNGFSRKRWLVYRDHDYCSQRSMLA